MTPMLSAIKNFGVTFLISALLFGCIAYFATGFVTSTMNSIMSDEEDELNDIMQNEDVLTIVGDNDSTGQTSNDKAIAGDSFNFLVITTDYRPDLYDNYTPTLEHMYETDWYSVSAADTRGCLSGDYRSARASAIVLVRVDKEAGEYIYTYFSPETQVYTTTGYHTLAEVYGFYGKQTLAEHIHVMTGLKIKYTLLLNAYNIDEFVELCGNPTVTISKDIYIDSDMNHTMQIETTNEVVDENGEVLVEHIPNTLVIPAGEVELTAENFDILNSVTENSASDVAAREAWTIDIVKSYLKAVSGREDLKTTLAQLITNRSEWKNIEGYTEPETEPVSTDENVTDVAPVEPEPDLSVTEPAEIETPTDDDPYNPWEDDGEVGEIGEAGEAAGEGEDSTETETEETIDRKWLMELNEPDGAILETDYTMNDYGEIYELFKAIATFEEVNISYPGKYVASTEDTEGYFDPDIQSGIERFTKYRD